MATEETLVQQLFAVTLPATDWPQISYCPNGGLQDAGSDRDSRAATLHRQPSESARLLVLHKHYVRICSTFVCSQSSPYSFRLMSKSNGIKLSRNKLLMLRDMME